MTPRLSVIMPVYNGAAYVADAVRSVLASRGPTLELLLVDDGSTDASVAIAEAAADGDARLRVLRIAHAGVGRARQTALLEARGEYVANLDSDDVTMPDRFARQAAFLDAERDHVAVGSRVLAVDEAGKPLRILIRHFTHEEIDSAHLAMHGGALGNPTAMFRRQSALDAGGYIDAFTTVGEDMDFWLRLAEVGRLANLPDVLIRYRMHGANLSLNKTTMEARHEIMRAIVMSARKRRGLPSLDVAAQPAHPAGWERPVDTALLHYFCGRRVAAITAAVAAVAAFPSAPPARSALRTVIAGSPPSAPSTTRRDQS
jgi:glycosyltransferase involved in cell wall biosynthesis